MCFWQLGSLAQYKEKWYDTEPLLVKQECSRMKSLRNLRWLSRFPNSVVRSRLPNAYFKNIRLFILLLFINIMKRFSFFLSFSSRPVGVTAIVCEPIHTIPFGLLAVELAIVFCLSSLIKVPAEEQLSEPERPLHQRTLWAARLAASDSQHVGLTVRSIPNQSRVLHLLHHNGTETYTFKSQCNVRVSGSRASARDDQC